MRIELEPTDVLDRAAVHRVTEVSSRPWVVATSGEWREEQVKAHDLETWSGGQSASFVSARQHAVPLARQIEG